MASITNMITTYTALLPLLLTPNVNALHAHRRSTHKHTARQLVVPFADADGAPIVAAASPPASPLAAITVGNAAIQDIQSIQSGLSDLPSNLLAFIQAVNQRLEGVESVLQGLVSSSSQPVQPPPSEEESASSAAGWSSFLPPPPTPTGTSSSMVQSTSVSTARSETGGAIEEAPAPYTAMSTTSSGLVATTTYTTRLTSTRTRTRTSTTSMRLATGTGMPYQPVNGTTIAPSAVPPAVGTGAIYPITIPLNQTFETTLRAAATPEAI